MPRRGQSPYKYGAGDDPVKVAAKYNITPQQLIEANPGAWPASTGQTINIPSFNLDKYRNTFQQGAQYGPVGALYGATNAASQIGSDILGGTSIAAGNLYRDVRSGTQGYQAAYRRAATPGNIQALGLVAPGVANSLLNSQAGPGTQGGYSTANPILSMSGANSFQSGSMINAPGASATIRRGGSPNAAAMFQLIDQAAKNPDSLSPEQQQQVTDYINQRAGNTATDAQGNGYNADPSQSPGGQFIQVGEKRWERNKHGRLVQVQYTGGGSWRNKRVISGEKNQSRPQQVREDSNGRLAGVGLINFSVGSG